jgi:Rv2632c-like/Domain of unknown function (DUF1918)
LIVGSIARKPAVIEERVEPRWRGLYERQIQAILVTKVPTLACFGLSTHASKNPQTEGAANTPGATMEAAVGDRIVVAAAVLGGHVRDGEIIEMSSDGGPPYLVRWSDDGRETLFFPGPDAHVSHQESVKSEPPAQSARAAAAAVPHQHVKRWSVDLYLFEQDAATTAHAVLHTDAATQLDSRAEARRNPSDADVPEIGDEVAAARALRRLADRLLGAASDDIEAIEGHEVHLHP